MLLAQHARHSLPLVEVLEDGPPIWDAQLSQVDELLNDDELAEITWRAFCRRSSRSPDRGRPTMALHSVVRSGVLKHLKKWSFRQLFAETQRNLDYRAFTQFFAEETASRATLARNIKRLDAQALRELNERLAQMAIERGVVAGRRYRQDTTVCETNVHYPTESSLLEDGVRVLTQAVRCAEERWPALGRLRDRSRSVRRSVLRIARASRRKGEAGQRQRDTAYRALLATVRPVITGARRVFERLTQRRGRRGQDAVGERILGAAQRKLQTFLPRVERVVGHTRARICRGVTNSPDKLLSLFEPKTWVIRKGKAHKPNEFGRLVDLVEVENGFISDYRVLTGNPSDSALLIPALERHKERFGQAPHTIATDAGFWSAVGEREAYALGVKRVSIPTTGKLSALRRRVQRSRWFRQAQRGRANVEGRIAILKHVYGMNRCLYEGDEAMERWVGWCVLAHNLVVVARAEGRARRAAGRAP